MPGGIELFNMFARLSVQDSEFATGLNKASSKFKGFMGNVQDQMSKINGAINTGLKVMGTAVTAVGTIFAKAGFSFDSQMENYTTNFEVMLGDAGKAAAKVQELQTMAAKTPFGLGDLADATQTLLAFQVPADKSTGILRMLGDVALGNKEKLAGLATVFGQVSSAGKLQGQDLMQMINQGFNPLNYISKRTGESMEQLRDRMGKGKVTIDEVTQAFVDATSEGGQFYQGMDKASTTVSGLWSTLKDDFGSFAGETLQPIYESLKADIIPALEEALGVVRSAFREVTGYTEAVGGSGNDLEQKSSDWLTNLKAAWSDGKKETKEQVQQFIDQWKTQSGELRRQIEERRKALEGKGADTSGLDAQVKQLDEYDSKIEALLKKKKGKKFTKEDEKELEETVAARNKLAEELSNPMGEVQKAGNDFGKEFGSTIAAGIKKAGEAVAWAVKNWDKLSAGLKAAAIALGFFKVAMLAVNLIMAANPIGLIITGITALIAVFAYFFQTNEKFRTGVLFVWENLKIGFQKIIDAIVNSWNAWMAVLAPVVDFFKQIFGKIGDWFKGLHWSLPKITMPDWVQNVIAKIGEWWDKVKTWFMGLDWSLPTITMPDWVQNVIAKIGEWWDKVKTWFMGLDWSLPTITMPDWVQNVLGTISGWWDKVKSWFWGDGSTATWSLPTITMPDWVNGVLGTISGWWDKVKSWFWGDGSTATWSLPTITMPDWVQNVLGTVQGWWTDAQGWFQTNVLSWVLPALQNPETSSIVVNTARGWWTDAQSWFQTNVLSWALPALQNPETSSTVINTVSGWWNNAQNWFKGLSWNLPALQNPDTNSVVVNTLKGWGETLRNLFHFNWTLPEIKIPDKVKGIVGWVRDNITNPLKKLLSWNSTITVNYKQSSNGGGGSGGAGKWATGGIFTKATFFPSNSGGNIVGEAGPEGVLPLSRLWSEMGARLERAFEQQNQQLIDYDRIDRAGNRPVALMLDGKVIATTLRNPNSRVQDKYNRDLIYGLGGRNV